MPSRAPGSAHIKACLFDLDGLLINSEDLITTCINSILHAHARPSLPWSLKAQVQGRTAAQSNEIFQRWADLPLSDADYRAQLAAAHRRVFPTASFLPGVRALLDDLARCPRVDVALATSSTADKFALKTGHLREVFDRVFPSEVRVLGDDPRVERHKPAPDCYLLALEGVNERRRQRGAEVVTADECLVFEDALQGVEAGMRAGMRVVWCPHLGLLEELRNGEDEWTRQAFGKLFGLDDGVVLRGMRNDDIDDCVRNATNGSVRVLLSLERFPYTDYNIDVV